MARLLDAANSRADKGLTALHLAAQVDSHPCAPQQLLDAQPEEPESEDPEKQALVWNSLK